MNDDWDAAKHFTKEKATTDRMANFDFFSRLVSRRRPSGYV
jgi:hypothetical protein